MGLEFLGFGRARWFQPSSKLLLPESPDALPKCFIRALAVDRGQALMNDEVAYLTLWRLPAGSGLAPGTTT